MNPLDELIRQTVTEMADEHMPPADLAAQSVRAGRAFRRRRRVSMASAALLYCAAIAVGAVAIGQAITKSGRAQRVSPAGHAAQQGTSRSHPSPAGREPSSGRSAVPAWSTWPTDRVYREKPPKRFFSDLPTGARLLASGTMPDGIDFRIASVPDRKQPIEDLYGYRTQPIFGDEPGAGSPEFDRHAAYFAIEAMTAATWNQGNENRNRGFWLIVVAEPDTTSASYSADGHDWSKMHLENGIAVIKLQDKTASIPRSARLKLADTNGTYVDGPVDTL